MEPEFGFVAWVTRNLLIVIFVLLAFALLGGWLWYNHHVAVENAAVVPKAQAKVNAAQATAGGKAVEVVNSNAQKAEQTDAKVQRVTNNFNTYPAAKAVVDPELFGSFVRGVCLFDSANSLPECKRL